MTKPFVKNFLLGIAIIPLMLSPGITQSQSSNSKENQPIQSIGPCLDCYYANLLYSQGTTICQHDIQGKNHSTIYKCENGIWNTKNIPCYTPDSTKNNNSKPPVNYINCQVCYYNNDIYSTNSYICMPGSVYSNGEPTIFKCDKGIWKETTDLCK